MKNELEPWEEGLADRMKEYEFAFDARAFADFEALLAAETTPFAGTPAPAEPPPPGPTVGKSGFLGLFLLLGILGISLWFLLPARPEITTATLETTSPTAPTVNASVSTPSVLPAAVDRQENPTLVPGQTNRVKATAATSLFVSDTPGDNPPSGEEMPTEETRPPIAVSSSRTIYQVVSLPALSLVPINSLSPQNWSLPNVIPDPNYEPPRPRRDRSTLFPDIKQ